MDRTFTPAQAAKHAKCGRSSIMRALQSKELLGDRDNRNRWKITEQALEAWMEMRPDSGRSGPVTPVVSDQDSDRSDAMIQLTRDLAAAEATIVELRSQLEKTDARNADEIRRLERIIERLTAPKPTLLQRIFGAADRS